jgi:sugar lactone lactonase YvrE
MQMQVQVRTQVVGRQQVRSRDRATRVALTVLVALALLAGGLVGGPTGAGAADGTTATITTIAGTGTAGWSGDGGPATEAQLQVVGGVAYAPDGTAYVADAYNHRIRRIDVAGTITTIAGTGEPGFSGDGGPATEARLEVPWAVLVEPDGDLLVSDSHNHRIRRIDVAGTITTIAGASTDGQGGGYSGDGGPATAAHHSEPLGLTLAADGAVLVADSYNHRIRRIDPATGTITTIAGAGQAGPLGGFSGDGGPASAAALKFPTATALTAEGDLLLSDSGNHRIRLVSAATGAIATVAGSGTGGFDGDGQLASTAALNRPMGLIASADGSIVLADSENSRVRRIDGGTGVITTIAGTGTVGWSGDGGPATAARFTIPRSVVLDPRGDLVIADSFNHVVRRVAMAEPTEDRQELQVVVRSDAGDLLNGATVVVGDADGDVVARGTTWRGVFGATDLAPGEVDVSVRLRDRTWAGTATLAGGSTLVEVELALPSDWGPLIQVAPGGDVVVDADDTGFVRIGVRTGSDAPLLLSFTADCADPDVAATAVQVRVGAGAAVPATPGGAGTWSVAIPRLDLLPGDVVLDVTCPGEPAGAPAVVGHLQLFDPSGIVSDADTGAPVVGATVTLHKVPGWSPRSWPSDDGPQTCESNTSKQPGAPWAQEAPTHLGVAVEELSEEISPNVNPQATTATGYYGWDVAQGCWYVTVSAPGYHPVTSPVVGVPPEVVDLHLSLAPIGDASPTFSDVPAHHPFAADIAWLVAEGLAQGYPDGTYQPAGAVSRQSLAAFLWRHAGQPATDPGGATFADVPADHPFAEPIAWLVAEGLAQGYADGSFGPARPLSRQSLAAVLWRHAGRPDPGPTPPAFGDVPADHPFAEAIAWLAAEGHSQGYSDGSFRPSGTISRQAVAALLHRYLGGA